MSTPADNRDCTATGIDRWDRDHELRLGAWTCELPYGHEGPHWVDDYPAADGPILWDDGTTSDDPEAAP